MANTNRPSLKETLKACKRELTCASKGFEQCIASLQSEEKKLKDKIKESARTKNKIDTMILLRHLVCLRSKIAKLKGRYGQFKHLEIHAKANMHAATSMSTRMKAVIGGSNATNEDQSGVQAHLPPQPSSCIFLGKNATLKSHKLMELGQANMAVGSTALMQQEIDRSKANMT